VDSGGGGYGSPLDRDPEMVRTDVLEGLVSPEKARQIYGVIFKGRAEDESVAVDQEATTKWRDALRGQPGA